MPTRNINNDLKVNANLYLNMDTNSLSGDSNGAVVLAGYDSLTLKTQSSPRVTINSSGSVGIGTTSPSAKLDVRYDSSKDGIFVKDEGGGAVMLFGADGSNNARARFYNGSHSQNIEINSNAGSPTYFNAGNVGIGTTSPNEKLEVNGSVRVGNVKIQNANGGRIGLNRNTSTGAIYNNTFGAFQIQNNSTTGFEIQGYNTGGGLTGLISMKQSDGYVGIGIASPTTKFHIDDNATSGTGLLVTGGGVGNALATFTRDVGGSGSVQINSNSSRPQIKFAASSNTFALGVNGSTFEIADNATLGTNARLSITNTGNVGIGITNPNDILQVKSSMSIIDSNGTNVHCQLSSNASEGVLRIHNGTNYGLIARGSANNPYLGAYYGGSLNIVGFGSSDGSTIDDQLAVFDFGNSQFKLYDSKQLVIGDGADLRLFHNGSHSYIHNDTGDIYIENDTTDGDIFFKSDNGSGGLATYLKLDGGTTTLQAYKDLLIANDTAKIKLGASQDLQIYHDGSHSYIQDSGTGVLKLLGSGVTIQNAVGSENMLVATENGSVDLYYDSNKKLETTSTGVDITGITTSNAFRTDTSNTDYNVISRNSTSTTLWVQAAQSNSLQGIASFRYGSATVNQGTEVFRIRRDGVNVFGTNFTVGGTITGNSKNFSIPHPTKEGKRLVHSCLEGPEIGVYFRGRSTSTTIEMPDYWSGLVHLDSMTVELTAIGPNQDLYVANIADDGDVTVASNTDTALNYFYVIYGERKDLERLEVEIDDTVEVEEPEEVSFPD